MSRKRYDQTLVDELERDLREALSLEPSADFERRVRARIHRGPAMFEWKAWAAAAAVLVLAVGIGWRVILAPSDVPAPPGQTHRAVDVALAPEGMPALHRGPGTAGAAKMPASVRRARAASREPEVIVPEDNARALTRLIVLVRNGTLDEERLQPVVPSPGPATLAVAPLVVPLLPASKIDQTGTAPGGARE